MDSAKQASAKKVRVPERMMDSSVRLWAVQRHKPPRTPIRSPPIALSFFAQLKRRGLRDVIAFDALSERARSILHVERDFCRMYIPPTVAGL
ncbi:hypothetical protein [Haladaptatus caseinilyticus]|uniref:hypothetical protein n=1 Tax=Haladaptatus caseinilyticus TaxID=2993314 RepID=UPI00224B7C55|nr:hypothetical protein [Haladaptatus caseinilyticus]